MSAVKLTLASGPKANVNVHALADLDSQIAEYLDLSDQLKEDTEYVGVVKGELLTEIKRRFVAGCHVGDGTCRWDTEHGTVYFKDSYRKLAADNAAPLREALGETLFGKLFDEVEEVKLKRGVTIDTIVKVATSGGDTDALVERTAFVTLRKGSMAARATMSPDLEPEVLDLLDQVFELTHFDPVVKRRV